MMVTEPLSSLFSLVIGLVIGSFFNVLIYRLPREESIAFPGSYCPHCRSPIRVWENIPVLSYIVLMGKCSHCKKRISPRYPLVELVTGCAAVALWRLFIMPMTSAAMTPWQIPVIIVQSLTLLSMIPIFIIDCEHYIIPDVLTVPNLLLSVVLSFFPGGISPLECALGIAAGGGSLFAAGFLGKHILKKEEAMGGGDVRLMALAGALWGWKIAIATIFIASLLGSLAGGVLIVVQRLRKDRRIPFGPFLAVALWASVLTVDKLVAWYFHLLDRLISG
jgi:leader peptidase (prepilin peptidase) / N-methyltransferase